MSETFELSDEYINFTSYIKELMHKYIDTVEKFKDEAERTNDWAEYHKCVGKIEAYNTVIKSF